jgi:hypothetical protein
MIEIVAQVSGNVVRSQMSNTEMKVQVVAAEHCEVMDVREHGGYSIFVTINLNIITFYFKFHICNAELQLCTVTNVRRRQSARRGSSDG